MQWYVIVFHKLYKLYTEKNHRYGIKVFICNELLNRYSLD